MEKLLNEIKEIEEELESLEEGYANECAVLAKKPGFDSYANKWRKKIDVIAEKYAELMIPLRERHEELRREAIRIDEENRKKKYRDTY